MTSWPLAKFTDIWAWCSYALYISFLTQNHFKKTLDDFGTDQNVGALNMMSLDILLNCCAASS